MAMLNNQRVTYKYKAIRMLGSLLSGLQSPSSSPRCGMICKGLLRLQDVTRARCQDFKVYISFKNNSNIRVWYLKNPENRGLSHQSFAVWIGKLMIFTCEWDGVVPYIFTQSHVATTPTQPSCSSHSLRKAATWIIDKQFWRLWKKALII